MGCQDRARPKSSQASDAGNPEGRVHLCAQVVDQVSGSLKQRKHFLVELQLYSDSIKRCSLKQTSIRLLVLAKVSEGYCEHRPLVCFKTSWKAIGHLCIAIAWFLQGANKGHVQIALKL